MNLREDNSSVAPLRFDRPQPDAGPDELNDSLDAETEALLSTLKDNIDQLSELDATKIVRLHQRIMNDNYEIDSERLAEKLLELESALNQSGNSERD